MRRSPKAAKKFVAIFEDDDGRRKTTHFGAAGYGDYTLYWKRSPTLAREKRRQYIARHGATEDWSDPTTAATLSRFVLWEKPTVDQAVTAYKRRFSL